MTTFDIITLCLSIALTVTYSIVLKIKHPAATSWSDGYYLLKHPFLFQLWAIAAAFLTLPMWLKVAGEQYEWMAWLSCFALAVVSLTPLFKSSHFWQHTIGALTMIAVGISWCCVRDLWYIPIISMAAAIVSMITYNRIKKPNYISPSSTIDKLMHRLRMNDMVCWVENGMMAGLYTAIIIKAIQL